MFMHSPCICTSFYIFLLLWTVLELFYLLVMLVVSMALSVNPLRPRILFILVPLPLLIMHPSLSIFVTMMPTRHLRKNFLDEAFIRNAKSSWAILLTPTFPLLFTVENGSLFVTSPSLVLSCWFRSSTPTCTRLTAPYLILLLGFEVFLFLSHYNLLRMCLRFLG